MPGSFVDQRLDGGGCWGNKVKRPLILQISPKRASLRQEDVLISSFLQSTGGQGSKQRHFSLIGRGAGFSEAGLTSDYNNKSNEKQVKEIVPPWVQNWLPPCNTCVIVNVVGRTLQFQALDIHPQCSSYSVNWNLHAAAMSFCRCN